MEKLNKSIASVATLASSGTPNVWGCASSVTTLKKCENSTANSVNEQICYCDAALCADITQCKCNMGDGYTPYANAVKNTEWAEAENGAPRQVIATAFATVLSAVGAFWLL